MQPGSSQGFPVVYATEPISYAQNMMSRQLIVFGSLQIGFGVFSFLLEAASLGIFLAYYFPSLAPVGCGFWTGVFFIVTGSIGVTAGAKRNKCCTIAFNVLSIISAALTAVLFSLGIVSAIMYGTYYRGYYPRNYDAQRGGIAMESLMVITAVAEAIVAIWSSVVCCKITCCCDGGDGCCCCPPSTYTNQFQNSMTNQPVFGQYPAVQQHPIIMINGLNQPQPIAMTNQQQPVTYTLPNGQQLIIMPNPQQETVEETSDRANLIK